MKSEVSALMDGAVDESAVEAVFQTMKQDASLKEAWSDYHLIGDALRGELSADETGHGLSLDFTERLMARLADEPTVLAPPKKDSYWQRTHRFLLPLAASVMGVSAVAWIALSNQSPLAPSLSARSEAVPVAQVSATPSARQLSEYMLAHEGYSPRGSIQGVALYVRGVADTRPGGAR